MVNMASIEMSKFPISFRLEFFGAQLWQNQYKLTKVDYEALANNQMSQPMMNWMIQYQAMMDNLKVS